MLKEIRMDENQHQMCCYINLYFQEADIHWMQTRKNKTGHLCPGQVSRPKTINYAGLSKHATSQAAISSA